MRLPQLCVLALFAILSVACARSHVEQTKWHSLDAFRLSNGTVELIAVPSIGRVVHYSYLNGTNVLWTNPKAGESPEKYTNFKNYGGEKIWLWPQKEWPPAADSLPCVATVRGDTLSLLSAQVPGTNGIRILRHIRMDPSGTGVTLTAELQVPEGQTSRIALWSVAQVPPSTIRARQLAPARNPGVHSLDPGQQLWNPIHREGAWLIFQRTAQSTKSGLEADVITSTASDQTFRIEFVPRSGGTFDPGTRAQIYADGDRSYTRPLSLPPYIEIEFLSPWLTDAAVKPTLMLRWTLGK